MKKFLLSIVCLLALTVFVNAQSTQTYNFSATVAQYIEVNPTNATVDIAPVGNWAHEVLDPAIGGSEVFSTNFPDWKVRFEDNVYSNTPFQITYIGEPVLSREEVNGNGFDRLQTWLVIRNEINGSYNAYEPGHERYDMSYLSGPEGAATGSYTNQTVLFTNPPHDGEVETTVFLSAALPHLSPDFGVDNVWNQSADAGTYKAQVVAIYSVTPW